MQENSSESLFVCLALRHTHQRHRVALIDQTACLERSFVKVCFFRLLSGVPPPLPRELAPSPQCTPPTGLWKPQSRGLHAMPIGRRTRRSGNPGCNASAGGSFVPLQASTRPAAILRETSIVRLKDTHTLSSLRECLFSEVMPVCDAQYAPTSAVVLQERSAVDRS